ncbi:MAG: patatin-like phospholipase family protein [Alphaproteobacteria bacterium]|nr:patatin-like phospholipase family protein [Alphaproteobacteria bacterium]
MSKRARKAEAAKPITLALQGGGAHGAFTWGVLDRLLEDERLRIVGLSGTSAGAMNGAMVVCGLSNGGPQSARSLLDTFWRKVSDFARLTPLQPTWLDRMVNPGGLDFSPGYRWLDMMSRILSPYQLNLLDFHPLRDILEELVSFDCLRASASVPLFVSATNVRSGKIKIFRRDELSVDALLASACLPELYQAVEIDGEHYWDGGYMGNPAVFPLLEGCDSNDVILVQINPIATSEVPTTARDILDRINEISFNSSLMREMRAIAFITKLIQDGSIDERAGLKKFHVHMIEAEEVMSQLGFSSKLNIDWEFIHSLRELGRQRADAWLTQNYRKLGVESSIDIDEMFL